MMRNRYDFEDLKNACSGQWASIFGALCHVDLSDAIANAGRKHVHCFRDHSKNKTFRVFPNFDETGGAICTKSCGSWPDGFELLGFTNGWDRKTAVKEVALYLNDRGFKTHRRTAAVAKPVAKTPRKFRIAPQNAKKLEQTWSETKLLAGTIGERYLRDRGLDGELPSGEDVRFHPGLKYWDAESEKIIGEFPAIVSQLRSAVDGFPLTLHRIYLDPKRGKAKVRSAKKLSPCAIEGAIGQLGAAIRLYPIDGPYVGITEGLETAMAIRCAHPKLPVWAAYSAGVLTNFKPPKGVSGVYVFGDVDSSGTGQMAAVKLAFELEQGGTRVKIRLPVERVSVPDNDSSWFKGDLKRADFVARLQKDGYGIVDLGREDVDWLDVWNQSKARLISAIPRQP